MKIKDFISSNELLLIAIGIIILFPLFGRAQAAQVHPYSSIVKAAVTDPTSEVGAQVNYQLFLHTDLMNRLYSQRDYTPIWITTEGRPAPNALKLKEMLLEAYKEGLPGSIERVNENGQMVTKFVSRGYWDQGLEAAFAASATSNNESVLFELLATEAFLKYVHHIFIGRFEPNSIDDKINFERHKIVDKTIHAMNIAINNGFKANPQYNDGSRLAILTNQFAPEMLRYQNLKRYLEYYRNIKLQGGWTAIASPGVTIAPGVNHPAVAAIRQRLKLFGYNIENVNSTVYDDEFGKALRLFQSFNNLPVDGVIGANTSKVLRYLNASVDSRIDQIVVNMERLRWLPRNMGNRYVFVNLAMAEFRLIDSNLSKDEIKKLSFRTINGKDVRQTPLMIDKIKTVIFNPTWGVPDSIALKDKLPILRQDSGYLAAHRMKLIGAEGEVDPLTVDFKNMTDEIFVSRYRIVQMPGYDNALGVVKFPLVLNKKDYYMHDTNERELFKQENRHFSSGCIRLQYPLEFAAYLLRDQEGFSLEKIRTLVPNDSASPAGKTFSVKLTSPMTVYVQYLTVEITTAGQIRFADDVYGQDEKISAALKDPKNNGVF